MPTRPSSKSAGSDPLRVSRDPTVGDANPSQVATFLKVGTTAIVLALVEDDVHGLLPEERPVPLAALAPERTYYLTSTSKTLAPGLRIAYVLSPAPMVSRLTDGLRATTWAVVPLTAAVASSWIAAGTADAILAERRREAQARQRIAHEVLAGADVETQPEAYYLWLRLPEPWRRDSFTAVLMARGVSLTSADAFAVGREPGAAEDDGFRAVLFHEHAPRLDNLVTDAGVIRRRVDADV